MTERNNWLITETRFHPAALHHKETVFTIGNGYLGTRGTFEEGYPGDRPATFVHGLFDAAPLVNTELVNAPNWLPFVPVINGERFRMDRGTLLSYRRELHLRNGLLKRTVCWRSPAGHTVELRIERFASLADRHLLAIRCRIIPLDFDGILELRAGLDGHALNPECFHWHLEDQGACGEHTVYLHMRTRHSGIALCEACHLTVSGGEEMNWTHLDCDAAPAIVASLKVRAGEPVSADKLVSLVTSREAGDVVSTALSLLEGARTRGYDGLLQASTEAWAQEWDVCDITIEGDDQADQALRYNLFQLLIAAPRHDDRASIPAKALSGFGYRGHVFWDTEIFMLPFFTFMRPELARNMLMYRYHTLPGARRKAQEQGYAGAMFAWESADTGDETTPRFVPGPNGQLVRIWTGDIEHHITADVAYAIVQYWQATGDDAFMRDYGAEIVLDTARFWGSRVEWNQARAQYEINDVIGPDEYHEHVNNNAFTNRMAQWNLENALDILAWLRLTCPDKAAELETRLELTEEQLSHWRRIIGNLYIPRHNATSLLEQFDGFFALGDINLADYEPRTVSMQALLGIEGVQQYQVLKQPDVLMLLYLLREEYDIAALRENWAYYAPRTDITYGSSLGPAIHALLAARLGEVDQAYHYFMHAARTDLDDTRGNAADGIHAATAGGLWQAVVFGFAGLRMKGNGYTLAPHLPPHWRKLAFTFYHRGKRAYVSLPDDETQG
ncbi:MAG: glycoside hydrolase family 65 protein [Anaerolineae bacterium]|nr:glycoside hydrolase family 65 protein [Anaerolineae bacterium]